MTDEELQREWFDVPLPARMIVAAVAGGLLVLCLTTMQTAHHLLSRLAAGHGYRDTGSRLFEGFVYAACIEILTAFAVFCGLTIVWAVYQPAWAPRMFDVFGRHVWKVLILFILGSAAIAALFIAAGPG